MEGGKLMGDFQLNELRKKRGAINRNAEIIINNVEKLEKESNRVADVADNAATILSDLNEEFEKKTGLDCKDTVFLFLAIGLQIMRQYLLTNFPERLDDGKAAQITKDSKLNEKLHNKAGKENEHLKDIKDEHSDRHHRYYCPSLEEIITNPVPFDALVGANGNLSGGGNMGHRATAIGHDPVLGLIFGTANIATSTLTNYRFQSFHITTGHVNGRGGPVNKDVFGQNARTDLVIKYTMDKLLNQGAKGKTIIACSFLKEIIHLQSDINTKKSLPLPIISVVDIELASKLSEYGIDMANIVNVSKQATYSIMINYIISMLHGLLFYLSDECNKKIFEVKTRKIIMYSNLIAASTNVAVVAVTKDFKKLDLGGIAVAIHRLINDTKFINDIKQEFVFGKFDELIKGKELELEEITIWE